MGIEKRQCSTHKVYFNPETSEKCSICLLGNKAEGMREFRRTGIVAKDKKEYQRKYRIVRREQRKVYNRMWNRENRERKRDWLRNNRAKQKEKLQCNCTGSWFEARGLTVKHHRSCPKSYNLRMKIRPYKKSPK